MTISVQTQTPFRGDAGARGLLGPALLIASAAAALPVFWYGLVSLVGAWSTPEYSHGPIIPLISTFLFLREMRHVPPSDAPVRDRWPGVAVAAAGLAIGVLGNLVRIPDITTYGLMIWIAGVTLTTFGLRRGAAFWPALVHLVFMLPLPQFVYWQVSVFLQGVSSELGVAVVRALNIPVFLDGNVIDLGVYKLQVAEACSGLRYLFPMLSFSYVFSVLYQGPVWHKVLLLLCAAPITVLMNSFRIGMIGVLVNAYGIEHAEGFLHAFEGWIIFVACVGILFVIAALLQRTTRAPKPLSETLDVEFEGLGAQARRLYAVVPSAAMMALLAATTAAAAVWLSTPDRATVLVDRERLEFFPRDVGSWSASVARLDPEIEAVLGADDYFSGYYVGPEGSVDLFMAYYHKQTEGGGIHSPEVCLPTGGWEVAAWNKRTLQAPGEAPFEVVSAVIQKGLTRQLAYFWFEQRGRRMTSDYAVKFVTMLDALRIGRTDGGLVRLITPLGANESEADGDARLQAFYAGMSGELARFFPE